MKRRKKLVFDRIVSLWTFRTARRRWLAQFLFAASVAAAAALPAWAEEDPTLMPPAVSASTAPVAAPADAPAAPGGDAVLPEVVVTGERELSSPKYTAPLKDVPQTITVVPEAVMKEQGATTLRDVLRNVPGISIQAGEGGVPLGDNLSIRGFAARTDLFVDGVRDFGGYSRDSFNFEQVEVVKGPASAYAGRGSTGGSINMATKSPRLNDRSEVSLRAGTEKNRRATLDVNRAVAGVEGMAVRLNAMTHSADVPGRDVTNEKRRGLAPAVAFGLGSPTRVTLSHLRLEQENVPDYGIPWVTDTHNLLPRNAPPPVDFENFYGLRARDFEEVTTDVSTLKVERDLGGAATLRNLSRWGRTDRLSIVTAPRFASAGTTAINRNLQDRDQVDTILANQTDVTVSLDGSSVSQSIVAGVEVSRERSVRYRLTAPAAPAADLFNPDAGAAFGGPVTRSGEKDDATADTVGVYAFDTVKVGDRWEFPVGLRWDHLKAKSEDGPANGVGQTLSLSRTDRMVSWRAAVVFKPSQKGSVYAGYGTSFNPAAEGLLLSASTTSAANVNIAPEKNATVELGTKWDVVRGFSLGAAVFRTDKTNARTPSLIAGEPNVLDGEQRVEGAELSASGSLNRWWDLFAAATFLRSEVVASNTPGEAGRELSNTPRQSYSLWTAVHLPKGWQAGAGAQAVGSRFNSTSVTTRRQAPGYLLTSAMLAWAPSKGVTFRLNGDNLADKVYIDRVGGGHFIPGPGRSVSLTTDLSF